MTRINKIKLVNLHSNNGPALLLGPGSTWGRVLKKIPPDRYTMVHGVCTGVGVGGFLLGGGVNYLGTSQRFLSGSSNVLEYTMVDAKGDIYKVFLLYSLAILVERFFRKEGLFFLFFFFYLIIGCTKQCYIHR